MVMCFAPGCKHYSEKHGCRFFLFPKEPEETKKWLQLLGRDDKEPTKYSLVCSCHFVGGERKNMPTILHCKDNTPYRSVSPDEKKLGWRMHRGESANGFSTGEEDSRGPPDQICCLVDDGVRCQRQAGNASYSKRIQKIVTQRRLKLHLDQNARHIYICDHHKSMIQSARAKRRRKDSEEDSNEGGDVEYPEIDLGQLQINTLRRYKKHFKVPTRPGLNKPQLSEILQKHFKSLPVSEKDIVSNFYKMVRTNGNKLDIKNGGDSL